jgi:AcrR family transcriptional regulator
MMLTARQQRVRHQISSGSASSFGYAFMSCILTPNYFRGNVHDMKLQNRPYVMKARAEAAAETRERILASTRDLLLTHPFDEMTVEAIAAGAATTVRTVLRIFSSKEQVFVEALHSLGTLGQAPIVHGNIPALVRGMHDFYEKVGDTVIRWLADEGRVPALREHLAIGRDHLRLWVAEAFAPDLSQLHGTERAQVHQALIVAFDVYTWKLLRRDSELSRHAAHAVVCRMVTALIEEGKNG